MMFNRICMAIVALATGIGASTHAGRVPGRGVGV